MPNTNVVVRPSPIQGVGIFAARPFRASEIILRRDESRDVTPDQPLRADLGEQRRHCDDLAGGRVVLLGYPDRHLNHSCNPTAYVRFIEGTGHICARRHIASGKEITSDYCINGFGTGTWPCNCKSARCRSLIHINFFEEPLGVQREYLSLLATWFIAEHPREIETLRNRLAS